MDVASAVIAQGAGPVSIGPYLLWVGLFLVVVIGAGLGVLAYRKAMLSTHAADSHSGILDGLRKMRDSGQISQAEYDATRKSIAARAAGRASPPSVPGGPIAARPAAAKPATGGTSGLTARPGFDLTGAPLPKQSPPPPE